MIIVFVLRRLGLLRALCGGRGHHAAGLFRAHAAGGPDPGRAPAAHLERLPAGGTCPWKGRDKLSTEGLESISPEIREDDDDPAFSLDGVDFTVEKRNFRISARTEQGLLYPDRSGLAYNFAGELGDGSVHYTRREPGSRSSAWGTSAAR